MKSFRKFIWIMGIILLVNCTNDQKESQALQVIDIEGSMDNMDVWNLSHFASSLRYVALETKIDNFLTYIQDYLETDKYLILKNLKQLMLFDTDGKFIRQIGNVGRGPGEYQFVMSMGIINDSILTIQSLYDLINLRFDGSVVNQKRNFFRLNNSNDEYFLSWIILEDSLYLGHAPNTTGLIENKALIINQERTIKRVFKNYIQFQRIKTVASGFEDFAHIYPFEKRIFYKEFYNDTLFVLDDDLNLIPKYVFNFGKFKEPTTERAKLPGQGSKMSEFLYAWEVFQTDNYLFISCQFGDHFPAKRLTPRIVNLPDGRSVTVNTNTTMALGVFDKKSRILSFSEPTSSDNTLFTSGLYNDIDGGPRFYPTKQVNDSTMLMWINAEDFLNHISSDDFKNSSPKDPEKKKQLEEFATKVTMFDNPILMYMTFKK
jgi:hypothetical protein